jgi:eukaryotic-like serine/threonine-protein kinase
VEFQKVLNHRGVVLADPIGALAHLQLGRAYAISRDLIKAKSACQDFFTLWKDADPDIPILKQARTEYAKLKSFCNLSPQTQWSRFQRIRKQAFPLVMARS